MVMCIKKTCMATKSCTTFSSCLLTSRQTSISVNDYPFGSPSGVRLGEKSFNALYMWVFLQNQFVITNLNSCVIGTNTLQFPRHVHYEAAVVKRVLEALRMASCVEPQKLVVGFLGFFPRRIIRAGVYYA